MGALADLRRDPQRMRAVAAWGLLLTSHALAVVFSRGYLQMDEHFQVLEFLQWKFGAIASADMPWELPARMRPWLHVFLFYPLEWFSHHVLELSPFLRSTWHRGCVAALSLFAIRCLTRQHASQLWLFATLFFFPLFDVRLSSEVIGGYLFAIGYALDEAIDPAAPRATPRLLGLGFLFGMAVVIRLMVAAMFGGLLLFHLQRRAWRRVLLLLPGVVGAQALGVLCDRIGYGELTWVPWNYFEQNILRGNAVHFGFAPFYGYVTMLLEQSGYVVGAVLLGALFFHWLQRPRDRVTCVSLPFVVLHACIAHKELRYLFPIAPFLPAMLATQWQAIARLRIARPLAHAFIGLNLVLMTPAVSHDANAYIGIYAALFEHASTSPSVLHYKCSTDPLRPWTLRPSYYVDRLALSSQPVPPDRQRWHGLVLLELLGDYRALRRDRRCELLASRYPRAVLDAWPPWLPERHAPWLKLWSLWQCP
jgi:phosphatidylinositol glycan class B